MTTCFESALPRMDLRSHGLALAVSCILLWFSSQFVQAQDIQATPSKFAQTGIYISCPALKDSSIYQVEISRTENFSDEGIVLRSVVSTPSLTPQLDEGTYYL